MNLKPGMRVLDVGCGVGGPAREIARFADVNIVGLNNNEFQVGRARKYAAKAGLSDQITFVKGDFMKLSEQFGENSFDAVYAIEATVHAPSFEGVYGEIMKVLKPGGIVSPLPLGRSSRHCTDFLRSTVWYLRVGHDPRMGSQESHT
jgi:sterol 24-C-methyltransferase